MGVCMVFADFIALMIASAPAHPPPAPEPGVTPQKAVVATEEAPVANDLVKPAVVIEDGSVKAVVSESGTRWIV